MVANLPYLEAKIKTLDKVKQGSGHRTPVTKIPGAPTQLDSVVLPPKLMTLHSLALKTKAMLLVSFFADCLV
jgi:hypothetical protein